MHNEFNVPRPVQKIHRNRLWACIRPGTIKWMKKNANRRQRRYMRQLMDRFCNDPELYWAEGLRGLPRPLTHWDID